MDLADIQASEQAIISEMSQPSTISAKASRPSTQFFRNTSEVQAKANEMSMKMLRGDDDVTMAGVMAMNSKSSITFKTTSMMTNKITEGLKTILNTQL